MDLSENVLKAYFNAVFNCSFHFNSDAMKEFASIYPEECKILNAFYRARSKISESVHIMSLFGDIQWFTLTFDNDKDKCLETTKRKQAQRFLNSVFDCYLLVEEHGEDKGRYHVHGFGIYKMGKGFTDFIKWDSRNKVETLTPNKYKKKVKYLTKYTAKQLPRIRRSKSLVFLAKQYKKHKRSEISFPQCFKCSMNNAFIRVQLGYIM